MLTDIQVFIDSNLKDVKRNFFGIEGFKFFNIEMKTTKIGFLGGGVHSYSVYELYLNGKLIRKFVNDFDKMLSVVETYAKIAQIKTKNSKK